MRANTFQLLGAMAGLVAGVSTSHAAAEAGRGSFTVVGSVRAEYDSNIFVNSSEIDDLIGTLGAGVRYVRDEALITLTAEAGATALAFADYSDLNTIDPYLTGRLGYVPSDKTELRGSLDVRRSSIANEVVNDRTESNDVLFSGSWLYLFSEKTGFRAEADYTKNDFRTPGYSDVSSGGIGLHGVYAYSPKLKLLAGLTSVEWSTENRVPGRGDPSSSDLRYTIGAEGDLTAKVTGVISVGVVQRKFDSAGFEDEDSLYLSGRLNWQAGEKTHWSLLAEQDLALTAADQSIESFNLSLGANHAITEKVSVDASVGYHRADYASFNQIADREDDGYIVRGRISWELHDNLTCDFSVGYRDNNSSIPSVDYSRVNIGVGGVFRF